MQRNKKEYYASEKVVNTYLKKRYSGKSGEWIKKKELLTVKSLLPKKGKIIDIGCGTGRLQEILDKEHNVTGIDSSKEMLRICPYKKKKEGDATKLPVKDKEYDVSILLRVLFHYKEIKPFLEECKRVTKKQGYIIFETYAWSPRTYIMIESLGGKIYSHKEKEIKEILKILDLKYIEKESIFLLSPYIQKHLPYFIVKILDKIEKRLPNKIKVDHYWKVQV